MPAETRILRIDRPFIGGLRDDPREIRHAARLVDGIYPLEILVERGGWTSYGEVVSGGDGRRPVAALEEIVYASGETDPDMMVAGDYLIYLCTSPSRVGVVDTSLMMASTSSGLRFMRGLFNGEVLILPQDGETPIMCSATELDLGEGTAAVSGAITGVSVALSDALAGRGVTAASDSFSPNDVGKYITIEGLHGSRRITKYVSGGKVAVDEPWDAETSGDVGRVDPVGRLGLHTEVTRLGRAQRIGAGTTITGTGTRWATTGVGQNGTPQQTSAGGDLPHSTDVIAPVGVDYSQPLRIYEVASDTSITLQNNAAQFDASDYVDYVIGRPLVGKVACVHEGRLYTAGVAWAPRRLQISPPLWNGRTSKNGEFSYEVDIAKAMMTAYQDVPSPFAAGEITGLLSLPSGNLAILSTIDVFIAWGQYPAISFRKQADVGNFSGDSCIAVDEGAWFAGPEGVFEFVGNQPRSITEGHIDSRWRRLMNEGGVSVALGFIHDHLFVAVHTDASDVTYVYDRRTRTWPGEWSLPTTITNFYASRTPGNRDRLLMTHNSTAIGDLSTTILDHETDVEETDNLGALSATLPVDVAGALSQEREVKYAKVEYQAVGGTLEVSTGPDATGPQETLPATTGDEIGHQTLYPISDVADTTPSTLGVRTRRWDMTVDRVGGTPSKVAVHEIELLVKEYRRRD